MGRSYASFAAWAADPDTEKIFAVEAEIARISDGATQQIYLATKGGVWDGTHYFEGYVQEIPSVTHRAQEITEGQSLVSYGDLKLGVVREAKITPSGLTWNTLLADYALAGRSITIRVGGPGLDYAQWGVVLAGYMGQPSYGDAAASVPVFAETAKLAEVEIPPNLYDDTYPSSTEGKSIPLCLGPCTNITPVLIDEVSHKYQFNDPTFGASQAVDALYDDGVLKTPVTDYTVDLTNSTVTLLFVPQGQITLDVRGVKPGGVYIDLPGEQWEHLITVHGGVATGAVDAVALAAYNTAVPFPVGIYLTNKVSVKKVIDSLLSGLLTIWGTTRGGVHYIQRFAPPAGSPDLEITDAQLVGEAGPQVTPEERLYWQVTIKGGRNWTLQSNPDSSLGEDRRQWLAEAFRQRTASDSAIKALYPRAETWSQETYLADPDDCATVATWWLALYGQRRQKVSVSTKLQPLQAEQGAQILYTRDRFGFEVGRLFNLAGFSESYPLAAASRVALTLWG